MLNETRLGLLYLGRLEKEKGFGLLLERILKDGGGQLPFDLYIFGAGSLESELLELQKIYPQIHYFGRKPLESVERYLPNIHYCLMPSLCLETFGLSAANVLSWGIPVIGFQKGGLKPFVLDRYDLGRCKGKSDLEKLDHMFIQLLEEYRNEDSGFFLALQQDMQKIAARYTKDKRFQNFQELSFDFKCRKIVLVSDFTSKIGGIETYLHEVKSLLETQGYQVKLFGSRCPTGFWGKMMKYIGLGISNFNVIAMFRLYFFLRRENPDLIWYHSVLRWHGWLGVWVAQFFSAKKWMMYHDLGYFHPFPSKLSDEKEVKSLTLSSFVKMAKIKNPLLLLFVVGKYLHIRLLAWSLRKTIDLHSIPSAFMEKMLHQAFGIEPQKIQTFPHFIQK